MALQLSYTDQTGQVYDHWRVISITFNVPTNSAKVTLGVYRNNAARLSGRAPLILEYYWEGADNPFTIAALDAANPIAITYTKLKSLPEFTGAVDV